MAARIERWPGSPPDPDDIVDGLRTAGLEPQRWSNGPGDTYEWHRHEYHKVLYCLSGSIVFHTRGEAAEGGEQLDDLELQPGDRLDLEPGTEHAATVGPGGVECVEAAR